MAMKYDPIMCMMVPDSVKTKDAVPNGWKVTLEKNRNKQYVYSKAMTARGAELEAKKEYPDATVLNVERYNVSDKKTIDKAITTCDKTEFYPQDISYIRKAIGTLKTANSLLGMINEGTVNKAKQNIANTISLLESID